MSHGGRRRSKGYPWAWLMYTALDLGLTMEEFWNTTPRMIMLLQRELERGMARAGAGTRRTTAGAVVSGGAMPLSMLPKP